MPNFKREVMLIMLYIFQAVPVCQKASVLALMKDRDICLEQSSIKMIAITGMLFDTLSLYLFKD